MTELEALLKELEEKTDEMIFKTSRPWEWGHADAEPNYLAATGPDTIKKLIAVIRRQHKILSFIAGEDDWAVSAREALEDCEKIVKGNE